MSNIGIIYNTESVFLIQRIIPDDSEPMRIVSLMDAQDLCDYLSKADKNGESYEIWDVTRLGETYKCHYKGLQPDCLIEVIRDFDEKLVCSMYGEDHSKEESELDEVN